MTEKELYALRYPIGEFTPKSEFTVEDISGYIRIIESFPEEIRNAVKGLNDSQLDTPYRPDGWTIRQVVHHTADSHINGYIRFKLALTEDTPAIKTYFEERWAELTEAKTGPAEISLSLLDALHNRWITMLRALDHEQLKRRIFHPETKKEHNVEWLLNLYAWHSKHHLAHITGLKKRMNW
jgi:hypothetical protein